MGFGEWTEEDDSNGEAGSEGPSDGEYGDLDGRIQGECKDGLAARCKGNGEHGGGKGARSRGESGGRQLGKDWQWIQGTWKGKVKWKLLGRGRGSGR